MPRAFRFFLMLALAVLLISVVGVGLFLWRSPDPEYAVYETVFRTRFHRYDGLIQDIAKRRNLDPMIIKAIVWRESRFRPEKTGLDGERGLMQITDKAAQEWVKGEKVASYVPGDLFDAKVNLEAGSWLIARALRRYEAKDDPLPFALAEYNAGSSRAIRWSGGRENSDPRTQANSQQFVARIDIPSTKHYIESVQERVRYYHQRGAL